MEDTRGTPELVGLIVEKHHAFARRELAYLEPLSAKVARTSATLDRRLVALAGTLREFSRVMLPHLDSEEGTLFPALLDDPDGAGRALAAHHADHGVFSGLLDRVASLTAGFTAPADAPLNHRELVRRLESFDLDTREHLHLENEVLLPRFL